MIYDSILIDVFNIACRVRGKNKKQQFFVKATIDAIEDCRSHLDRTGILYLLFDPCPNSDLDYNKSFHTSNIRKEILPDYKANRIKDPAVVECAKTIKKYYAYRGSSIVLCYGDLLEADDFVEPLITKIIKENQYASIALVSTDLDFSRYIHNEAYRIDLINKSWDTPFTKSEFEKTFEFAPTPASVVFYKAIFGDSSDCIHGAIFLKKAKFSVPIKTVSRDFLKYISEKNLSIDDTIKALKQPFQEVIALKEKTPINNFYLALLHADEKSPVTEILFTNVKVLRSALENADVEKFLFWSPEREQTNAVIHASIYGKRFLQSFGST